MEKNISDYRQAVNEIIPAKALDGWIRAKRSGLASEKPGPGNKLIDHLSNAIKKKYLPSDWSDDIRKLITVAEYVPHNDLRRKEKCLLYWSISRGENKICLPVVAIHSSDGSWVRSAFDKNGDSYFMHDRYFASPSGNVARVELINEDGKNLLFEHGFVYQGEVAPSQLQVVVERGKFVGNDHFEYYPNSFSAKTSLKDLKWKIERYDATTIMPWGIIEDLKLI